MFRKRDRSFCGTLNRPKIELSQLQNQNKLAGSRGTIFASVSIMGFKDQGFFILLIFFLSISCQGVIHSTSSGDEFSDSSTSETENIGDTLTLVAIDVGQGDSTLIVTPTGQTILIDGGPLESGKNQVLPLLAQLGIYHIDALFVSHYDGDHIGGIPEIVAGYDQELGTSDDLLPDHVYDRGGDKKGEDELFEDYLTAVGNKRIVMGAGESILFDGGLTIDCLIINGQTTKGALEIADDDENAHSMGLLISYGSFRYFTAGDLPGGGFSGDEQTTDLESLVAPLVGSVDVVHVNHHGSNTSSNEFFMNSLNPTVALISTGDDNGYGHPHADLLNRLNESGAEIYLTEEGSGGFLPSSHILNDSIFIFVETDGNYTVNGDLYQSPQQN